MAGNNALRVMVLDDQRVIVDALCMILKVSGFETRGVYTHEAAILAAHEFKPDVLLTGFVNCCEKDGCETAAEVLTFLPDCHIIVFSGQAITARVVDEYNRRGYAFEFYPKPIHPQDLIDALSGPRRPPFLLQDWEAPASHAELGSKPAQDGRDQPAASGI